MGTRGSTMLDNALQRNYNGDMNHAEAVCVQCRQPLKKARVWQRFCSPRCRWQYWDAQHPRQRERKGDGELEK